MAHGLLRALDFQANDTLDEARRIYKSCMRDVLQK